MFSCWGHWGIFTGIGSGRDIPCLFLCFLGFQGMGLVCCYMGSVDLLLFLC